MNKAVKEIIIIGGGSAGWLTAGILAADHNANSDDGINITLIESPNVSSVGVGEGTWPTMKNTLQTIGITEDEFIRCCDASFKQGSQFIGWLNKENNNSYYHPFVAPHGFGQCNLVSQWQQTNNNIPFAHALSFQPHLCDHGRAPKQIQTPQFAAVANYGYHLDATKFAILLQQHCVNKLGVKHVVDHVSQVNGLVNENISSISTQNKGDIKGDLFIDCSGSSALLIGKHYQIPFICKKDILFNDTALAIQVPYPTNDHPITSHTISTAQQVGWVWDIGLPSRRGVGYVYASDYISDTEAERVLRDYLYKSLPADVIDDIPCRTLSFAPGYREKFWHKNCVAVGMSAGFLEPLEASALALVELSAKLISKDLPCNQSIMEITASRFNKRFHYRWQRIIEFLKLHYVLSKRTDSKYWRDNTDETSIPKRLLELLDLWKYQEPSYTDFTEIEEIFPAASYQYVLYGMDFKTSKRSTVKRSDNFHLADKLFYENQQLCQKYLAGLPSNRELINHIIHRGIKN